MPETTFEYFCHVCGNKERIHPEVPVAPEMKEYSAECQQCGDKTNILITACPVCEDSVRYFISDLDFPKEVNSISLAYVEIIDGIHSSLSDVIEEFDVQLPKAWNVEFSCKCGAEYSATIPLARFEEL